jgi:hypothetical protein
VRCKGLRLWGSQKRIDGLDRVRGHPSLSNIYGEELSSCSVVIFILRNENQYEFEERL